jgi:Uncharacterized protein conserved in bacteria (DUF2188)
MNEIVNVRYDMGSGHWIVKREGGARASARVDTQEEGKQVGRRILARTGGELRVWNRANDNFSPSTIGRL